MIDTTLHEAADAGDEKTLIALLRHGDREAVNAFDDAGFTPLMYAAKSAAASAEVVGLLIERGAHVRAFATDGSFDSNRSVVSLALADGDPAKIKRLIEAGADISYSRNGFGAMLDAVHGRDILHDERLISLLRLLIAHGARLDDVSSHAESALRVLSRIGRFDALAVLLEAGADETQLEWTPLIKAAALGTVSDVQAAAGHLQYLEAIDWWERTAWLVAVLSGDVEKAKLLRDLGANIGARGRCDQPTLFYAIEAHREAMLRWLLDIGTPIDTTDKFGTAALNVAATTGNAAAIKMLLDAGANLDRSHDIDQSTLSDAATPAVAKQLMDAGADPRRLPFEARRSLLGLPAEPSERLLKVSELEFRRGWRRRVGARNPESMDDPFWLGMIRSGVNAYAAARRFGKPEGLEREPVWCAQRFGQSITFLPDGRIVQIGGEHEDFYDPDFCIYNDVFVHELDGSIRIYGYPEDVFPPTDFHTATLIGGAIYIIGSLGYQGARPFEKTPVHKLDTQSFRIDRVDATGDAPGWIYQHRAVLTGTREIRITGGLIAQHENGKETHIKNDDAFVLDVRRNVWMKDKSHAVAQ